MEINFMNKKYKYLLTGFLCFSLFFSFFQTSQAGFFDWFRKNGLQETATVVSKAKQYTLSVSKSGLGVVTSDDGKINCGKQCKASYPANSKIVLKAEAGNNYKFDRWNGCDKVSDGKCQITLNKSKMVVAKFVKKAGTSSSSQKVPARPQGKQVRANLPALLPKRLVPNLHQSKAVVQFQHLRQNQIKVAIPLTVQALKA